MNVKLLNGCKKIIYHDLSGSEKKHDINLHINPNNVNFQCKKQKCCENIAIRTGTCLEKSQVFLKTLFYLYIVGPKNIRCKFCLKELYMN